MIEKSNIDLANFKVIISHKDTGRSLVRELKDRDAQVMVGMSIGDELDSSVLGFEGGRVKITGGSDKAGFPMRRDIMGGVKAYVLLTEGVGFRSGKKGEKQRRLVRGSIITEEIYQVNAVLTKGDFGELGKENKSKEGENREVAQDTPSA